MPAECKCHDPAVPVKYDEDGEVWRDDSGSVHTPKTWDDYQD